jgi:N-acyl amino acid synthase of PEP-CTERM/exosortase system
MDILTVKQINTEKRLVDVFSDYFEVIPANTPELLEVVYRLRYQVYCLETGLENPRQFPDRLENDKFDNYSVHSLLRHQRTRNFAGTVRLILPRSNVENCFPIHEITSLSLFLNHTRFPRSKVAEVSRFAISKEFRKRFGEFGSPSAASDYHETYIDERRIIPHITVGLVAGAVKMSAENGIQHWFCVVEHSLLRLLSRYSLYLIPHGPAIEYHGKRQPCYVHLDQFLERARKERPDIWELITNNGKFCP